MRMLLLCFVSFLQFYPLFLDLCDSGTHIFNGCSNGTGPTVRFPQIHKNGPEGNG